MVRGKSIPSAATLELLELNAIDKELTESYISYLKTKTELKDIDSIDGYDNWGAFFIMFCIKTAGSPHKLD